MCQSRGVKGLFSRSAPVACVQEDLLESFADIPRARLERTYAVNILAMFSLAQKAVKVMKKGGSIINVGSIQAYMPTNGILDYASTKVQPLLVPCTCCLASAQLTAAGQVLGFILLPCLLSDDCLDTTGREQSPP